MKGTPVGNPAETRACVLPVSSRGSARLPSYSLGSRRLLRLVSSQGGSSGLGQRGCSRASRLCRGGEVPASLVLRATERQGPKDGSVFVAGGSVAWACCFLQRPPGEGPRPPLLHTAETDFVCWNTREGSAENTRGMPTARRGRSGPSVPTADTTQPQKRTPWPVGYLEPEAPAREPRGHRPGEPGLRARRGRWTPTPWFYDSQ